MTEVNDTPLANDTPVPAPTTASAPADDTKQAAEPVSQSVVELAADDKQPPSTSAPSAAPVETSTSTQPDATSTDSAAAAPTPPINSDPSPSSPPEVKKPQSPALIQPPAPQNSTSTAPTAPPKSQLKSRTQPRTRRPRRRGVADSDSEDDAQHSDNSLTDVSDSERSDDEEDEDAVEDAIDTPASTVEGAKAADANASSQPKETKAKSSSNGKGKQAAFPDSEETLPAAWADQKMDDEQVMTFDDFSTSKAATTAPSDGPAGGKQIVINGDKEKKVYTEEQTRRFEERKAKMKEKQKARKAELKEAKRRESGVPKPVASEDKEADGLVASTSPLALDDPSVSSRGVELLPSSGSKNTAVADPKVTPRTGQFWTHDQRSTPGPNGYTEGDYANTGGFGRGRGGGGGFGPRGNMRGGPRGRGRGFGPGPGFVGRGGFAYGGNRGQELAPEPEETRGKKKMMGDEGELEMDKLWAEMEAKDKARAEAKAAATAAAETAEAEAEAEAEAAQEAVKSADKAETETSTVPITAEAPTEDAVEKTGESGESSAPGNGTTDAVQSPLKPPVVRQPREQKWGHEGFESMRAVDTFTAARGGLRGRGRGRGGFFPREPFSPRRYRYTFDGCCSSRLALCPSWSIRARSCPSYWSTLFSRPIYRTIRPYASPGPEYWSRHQNCAASQKQISDQIRRREYHSIRRRRPARSALSVFYRTLTRGYRGDDCHSTRSNHHQRTIEITGSLFCAFCPFWSYPTDQRCSGIRPFTTVRQPRCKCTRNRSRVPAFCQPVSPTTKPARLHGQRPRFDVFSRVQQPNPDARLLPSRYRSWTQGRVFRRLDGPTG